MDKGWIKIYRQIQDNALWKSDTPFDYRSAWIDLIMMANVKQKEVLYRGQTTIVKRGDVYTSIRKLAARWHWSTGKVSRYLNNLVKLEMVKRIKSTKSATLLTLVNYEDFQSKRYTDRDTDRDADRDTHKHTDGRLLKNIKNEKEIKETATPISDEMAAVEDEEPPVPGAVRMPNGGWNYRPDLDDEEEE